MSQRSLALPAIRHASSRSCSCLARLSCRPCACRLQRERRDTRSLVSLLLFHPLLVRASQLPSFPILSLIFSLTIHTLPLWTLVELPSLQVARCHPLPCPSRKDYSPLENKQTRPVPDWPTTTQSQGHLDLHGASRRPALSLALTTFERRHFFVTLSSSIKHLVIGPRLG